MPEFKGKSVERERIEQLEEDIRRREKKLEASRDDGPGDSDHDQHLSSPQAWLLILVGALGLGGTGHIASLVFQLLLQIKDVKLTLMDPGIGFGQAIQAGLRSLGNWAPPAAFGLGILLLLYLALWPSFRNTGSRGDWRAWGVTLGLLIIPFFNFDTAGYVMGLPIGMGVACGLYGIGLGLAKSEGVRVLFEPFRHGWFGIFLTVAALGLMIGGFVMNNPAIALPGVLVASCFSLHLMSIGFEKRAKVRAWEQEESEIRRAKAELENLWREERIERELSTLLDEEES